ncbi:hypothetical protein AKJ44_00765 [candidate division MSBL1 archaeon SCGC-AAA261F17]|uniref:DDH domain-containing protein n=1 Tax=candidate division MSBL1 archaeon SCGC-AAA261F17 TaxID=1698274 RepID=A0A133V781_9EURY|nr:hypothetical protein AKJ44_00765 [candidate division MSBL1 archaeon SCGC-AAA261F17]
MKKLAKFLAKSAKDGKQILVIGHPHADPDAIGSIVALREILEELGFKVDSGVPTGIDRLAREVLTSLGGGGITVDPPLDADMVIVVDTSSLDQLEDYEEKMKQTKTKVIIIDHHRPNSETRKAASIYWVDEDASSTAELVLQLANELKTDLSPKTAFLLLAGIITDTGHFRLANESTFRAVNKLLEMGADYKKTLDSVQIPEDPSKRVAMLKAAQRAELHKSHGRWIIFSEIGAFESDAASLFVKIGADVALAGGKDGDEVRISARSRRGVVSETHLHLGKLMSKIAENLNGTGGGHAGAAAMTVERNLDEVKETTLRELKKMLKPK